MARKTKIERGFYPINMKDIRRRMSYCETWGYGNKDTCKYVAETTIEDLQLRGVPTTDPLYSDLICVVHDINNGARYVGRELLIPINEGE